MKYCFFVFLLLFTTTTFYGQNAQTDHVNSLHVRTGYAQASIGQDYGAVFLSAGYDLSLNRFLSTEFSLTLENGDAEFAKRTEAPRLPYHGLELRAGPSGKLQLFKTHSLSAGPYIGLSLTSRGLPGVDRNVFIFNETNLAYGVQATYSFPVGATTRLGLYYNLQAIGAFDSKLQVHRFGIAFIKQL